MSSFGTLKDVTAKQNENGDWEITVINTFSKEQIEQIKEAYASDRAKVASAAELGGWWPPGIPIPIPGIASEYCVDCVTHKQTVRANSPGDAWALAIAICAGQPNQVHGGACG
jgi:hypothetical protein